MATVPGWDPGSVCEGKDPYAVLSHFRDEFSKYPLFLGLPAPLQASSTKGVPLNASGKT